MRRVVVTGLGAITPIGNTLQAFRTGLKEGVSGANPITLFDSTNFKTTFACEVKNFEVAELLDKREARRLDRFSQFALVAAQEAVEDAGLAAQIEQLNS